MRFYGDDEICETCPPRTYVDPAVDDVLAWDAILGELKEADREIRMLLSLMTTDDFLEVRNAANASRA